VAASVWGTLGIFAKILYAEGVSFEALVAVRACVGLAAVVGFVLLTGRVRTLRVERLDLSLLVPLGLLGIGAFYLLYFYTVRESTVGTAAILLYSAPAFVVTLGWLFLGERLGRAKAAALALTAAGIFLVAGGYDPANLDVRPGILLTGLLSGLTYGLYSVFGRPLAGRLPPAVVLSYALLFGGMLLFVAALPTLNTLSGLSAGSYALLLMLAVAHTAVAFGLYTFGLKRLEAGSASIVATLEVVVASVAGVVLLGEQLTFPKLAGGLLVLAGAALAQVGSRKGRPGREKLRAL
jgi:DME family drug/metabolite transporter